MLVFDGAEVPFLPGETVAAALSASGVLALRQSTAGGTRGLWCGMGACWDCLVTIDGSPVRACMAPARPGMSVESAPATLPPPRPAGRVSERDCDVLVVGGGPAGLSAAAAAAESGASVVLLDERPYAGGQYFKHALRSDRQHRRGDALRARVRAAGVELVSGALVWGGFAVNEIAVVLDGGEVVFHPRRLILATGAHERPVPIPGWTLPGVMTVGAVQGLVRSHRVSPGQRVVLAGNGPLLLQVACELLDGGAQVAAVVEAAAEPGVRVAALRLGAAAPLLALAGLRHLRRLRRAGVPVLWRSTALACDGDGRFARLRVRTPAGERRIEADACALNLGFVPETGLARALGAEHRMSSRAPGVIETVTDEAGRTSLPGLFAVGDGVALGGAVAAIAEGQLAGLEAARELGFPAFSATPSRRRLRHARAFQQALWTVYAAPLPAPADIPDTVTVCRCEDVTAGQVRRAMADGARSLPAVKRATRAGMGRCQGRMCAVTLHGMCGGGGEAGHAAPRAPLRPVPIAALLHRGEAHETPIELPPATRWLTTSRASHPGDCDVLVIGGGLVGLCAALYLAQDGRDVVVADRGEPGMGASTANAGSLHVQLLPYDYSESDPGPLAETLPLGPRSIALWRSLAQQAGESLGLRTEGGLILAETEADLHLLRRKAAFERERGVETEIVGPADLAAMAPSIRPGYAGAAFCAAEGQGDPLRGAMAVAALAWRAGARPARGLAVQGLARNGAGWVVQTTAGPVRAGQVLNAAGPHATAIGALVGETLPVRGLVQQVIATAPVAPMLRQLVAQTHLHLSLKQGDGGHVLIGGGWPGRLDASGATRLERRSIEGNLWTGAQVIPALAGLEVVRAWTGLAVYLDRGPVICETQPGLFHAVTSNGYTLGPAVGRLIADAMLGRGAPPAAFALR